MSTEKPTATRHVRVWDINRGYGNQQITAQPKQSINHDAPVLCTEFSSDGTLIFSGGASKQVNMWNLGQAGHRGQQVGAHDAPVKSLRYIHEMGLIASASWDRTVKFWDMRTANPAAVVNLSERAYSMDVKGAMMVVATADRKVCVYNLAGWNNGPVPQTQTESPLRYQTRCVSIFPDQQGFAVGSIEGRVGIEYFSEQATRQQQQATGYKPVGTYGSTATKLSFAFKCHRVSGGQPAVYSVNSIAFHKYGTFATAGSDGNFHFWDKDSRQRLKAFDLKLGNTIPVCKFSADGGLFGYAISYDWSQGVEHASPQGTHSIYLHSVSDDEIKPRPKDKK